MNCERIRELFPDFLTGELDQEDRDAIKAHMAVCDSCREELESLSAVWTKLGVIPDEQPGSEMRSRFYTMLEAYKQGMAEKKGLLRFQGFLERSFERLWPRRPAFQFSLSLFFLIAGLTAGYILSANGRSQERLAALQNEVQEVRRTLAVSLLEKASPSDRLQGVSMTSRMAKPDAKILSALFNTLDNDPNVNVRMAAVDALYLFHDYPEVRQGLLQSLSRQTSPLVQVALIDLIVTLRERRAAEALKSLIRDEELTPEVREHAEQGLQQLSF